jgi:hypothetical protein
MPVDPLPMLNGIGIGIGSEPLLIVIADDHWIGF